MDLSSTPEGNNTPKSAERTTATFERSPLIKVWVLKNANGKCEACVVLSPFKTGSGEDYLEVHHMKPLAKQGTDGVSNAVALLLIESLFIV